MLRNILCVASLPRPFSSSRIWPAAGAGSAAESARTVRFLRSVAVLVAIVLRGCRRARHPAATAMRRAALFVRRAWAVAAIRARISGILPGAGAAARPQHRLLHAGSDAGAAADLPRMGQARHLFRPEPERLFRDHPQGARDGEDPAAISSISKEMLTVTPDEVEEAFVKANSGLTRDAIAVTCDRRRLSEVRICMGKIFASAPAPRSMRAPAAARRWSCRRCAREALPSRASVFELSSCVSRRQFRGCGQACDPRSHSGASVRQARAFPGHRYPCRRWPL